MATWDGKNTDEAYQCKHGREPMEPCPAEKRIAELESERDRAQKQLLRAVLDIYEAREYERCWFVDDDGDIGDCGNWPTCTGDCPLKRLGLVVGLAPQEDGGIDKQPKGGA
jgi:hypothetical protein